MSDRELLELAAKAAGYSVNLESPDPNHWYRWDVPGNDLWNPLTDDGDALRLAVKLRFQIVHLGVGLIYVCLPGSEPFVVACERGSDHYAVTRRAIVRAAAEIGKATP